MSPNDQTADHATVRECKLTLVERLADDLAHEIKNPLHSMVINLEVLRRRISRLDEESREELLHYASVVHTELERVSHRVDLLLRVVRASRESGDDATLLEIIQELTDLLELECERNKVELRIEWARSSGRMLLARTATRQMILSLALRTLDGLPPGGTLEISAEASPGWVSLRIVGRGPVDRTHAGSVASYDDPFIALARSLAHHSGGTLEPGDSRAVAGNGTGKLEDAWILSLPVME